MPARKRAASNALESETPRRTSRRISFAGEKSGYFENPGVETASEEVPADGGPRGKRGRPKKADHKEVEQGEGEADNGEHEPAKKTRGRPRKAKTVDEEPPLKKGPWGHPREAKAQEDEDDVSETEEAAAKKEPWGHPKKTKAQEAKPDDASETENATVKKGPWGHPKKVKAHESKKDDVEETTVNKGPWGHPKKAKAHESKKDDVEETTVKKGPWGHPRKTRAAPKKGDEEDEKSDDDDDDEGVRKVHITPKETLRPDGGVAYADERVHKNTLAFLKDLKANNNRPWLKSHDGEYRRALDDWATFVESFTQLILAKDETIPELPTKDVVFRIYRDTRFSKDPTPYKPHFSAAWSRTGRKGPYAVYYMHCEPGGKSMLAGGLWYPDKEPLAKLRASIDERPTRWRRALSDEALRREFLGPKGMKGGAEGAVKAFVEHNQEGALKKKPQYYSAHHRDIGLLKLKNFVLRKKIPDDAFTAKDGPEMMANTFGAMVGFVSFLNSIVMPDPNLDGDDDDDDDDEDDDDDANGHENDDSE